MKKKKVVLANSIGIDRNGYAIIHSPSRWTNSSKNKNVFTYYPWELAYATTLLKRETDHTVKLIDGCLEKYDHAAYCDVLCNEDPEVLVMEPATRTWDDDSELARAVKKETGCSIVMAGPHAIAYPDEVARVADHVLTGEYEMTLLELLRGKRPEDIAGLYPNQRRGLLDVNFLPFPEDEDVSRFAYAIPGEPSSEYIEIQAYATRGCPFHCSFCVAGTMYYGGMPSWRPRRVTNIIEELQYLRAKYPRMEGIFFDEEYHNVNKAFILELCRAIKANGLADLKIDAMCAYATLDREMMEAMKSAGYYLLRIGIETAAPQSAAGVNLGAKYNIPRLKQILYDAKDIGLKMYGTFTFGAPGSTIEADQKTLALMDELIGEELLWRFQTSICTPQPGTPYYQWAEENGYLLAQQHREFDGGNFVVVEYPDYPRDEILSLYTKSQSFFDIALRNRFRHKIYESIKELESVLCGEKKKVLLFRTSRVPQVKEACEALRSVNDTLLIDILLQDEVRHDFEGDGRIHRVFSYGTGPLCEEKCPPSLMRFLNDAAYDMVIVVYGNSQGQGYEQVHQVAHAIPAGLHRAFTAEGYVRELPEMSRECNAEKSC